MRLTRSGSGFSVLLQSLYSNYVDTTVITANYGDTILISTFGSGTLACDPLNRLDLYNLGTAKRFIYDGDEVVAELDSSGNIIGRYVRGDAPDEIITGYTSSDPTARGFYHLDNRNSVIAVTDPNGTVTASIATTNTASRRAGTTAPSSTPARCGSGRSASTITRRGCTGPTRGRVRDSCRRTRSGMAQA